MSRPRSWPGGGLTLLALVVSLPACGGASAQADADPARAGDAAQRPPRTSQATPPPIDVDSLPAPLRPGAVAEQRSVGPATGWARVYVRANPGPFQYVAYELHARGSAAVASHLRGTLGRKDAVMRTELMSLPRFVAVRDRLRDLGAAELGPLPPADPHAVRVPEDGRRGPGCAADPDGVEKKTGLPCRSARPIYELSWQDGERGWTAAIADPYSHPDARYARFIDVVRQATLDAAGRVAFHPPTRVEGGTGFLFIDSVPGARVFVDGVELDEGTPVLSYPTSPGSHTIKLVNDKHGLTRSYKVRVEPRRTTSLEVDLR